MPQPPGLNPVTVDPASPPLIQLAQAPLLATMEVHILEVERVDVPREVAQQREADVDEEVGAAARDQEDADGREEDGDYDEEEGGDGVGHGCCFVGGVVCLGGVAVWVWRGEVIDPLSVDVFSGLP